MSDSDPFSGAFDRPEQLREFYNSAMEAAIRKDIGHIDELCRRLIAAAPMPQGVRALEALGPGQLAGAPDARTSATPS